MTWILDLESTTGKSDPSKKFQKVEIMFQPNAHARAHTLALAHALALARRRALARTRVHARTNMRARTRASAISLACVLAHVSSHALAREH